MAFTLIKTGGQSTLLETKYLMADNEGCTRGEGLTLTSGRLTKVAATAVPEFIAEKTIAAAASSVVSVPTHKVNPKNTYEVSSTGQLAITTRGAKYTIHSDGLSVTTTTTSGVFEIMETDGATLSKVRGHF